MMPMKDKLINHQFLSARKKKKNRKKNNQKCLERKRASVCVMTCFSLGVGVVLIMIPVTLHYYSMFNTTCVGAIP